LVGFSGIVIYLYGGLEDHRGKICRVVGGVLEGKIKGKNQWQTRTSVKMKPRAISSGQTEGSGTTGKSNMQGTKKESS